MRKGGLWACPCGYKCRMLLFPPRLKEKLTTPFEQFQAQAMAVCNYPRLRVRLRWAWRKFIRIPAVDICRRVWRELGPDHAVDMAASVAFHALLSLFPLVIALIGLFSLALEPEDVERGVFWFFRAYLPGSDEILRANVEVVGNIRGSLGVIGLLGLIWTSSMLAGAISRAVNRAWDIPDDPPVYIDKLRQLAMVIGLSPLLLMSIAATTALQFPDRIDLPLIGSLGFLENDAINVITRLLPFAFSLVIFLMIYKYAPCTRTHWRYVWPGALLAAVMFEAAKTVFALYLDAFANHERIYGSLASVIVMMVWVYVSGFILVIGAEFTSEYERMRLGVERGRLVSQRLYQKTNTRRRK